MVLGRLRACAWGLSKKVAEPVPTEPWVQSCVCRDVAVQKEGERRAGAIPRNPTVARQARPSTAARMGRPIRLKDSSAVEALCLVLGPATQRSMARRRQAQPGSTRAPSSCGYYLRHSAAQRLNPANQRGKPVTELKLQPKSSWQVGRVYSNVASWPRGDSHAKCTANTISHPQEGSAEKAEDQLSLGRHGGCCLFGLLGTHQED